MCFAETPRRFGAYLPPGRAPPLPAKLWQAVQFVRKNWPPRTISSLLDPFTSYRSLSGTAGPGPSDWMKAPRALISDSLYTGRRAGACGPGAAIGIRPVPTWKSTAAAPTRTRDGPYWLPRLVRMPSAFLPWQDEQPTWN